MSKNTFLLIGISYYILAIIIIVIVLNIINKKETKKYNDKIKLLERDKNLIISGGILSELNKVESFINTDEMKEVFANWQERFKKIKEEDIPKISSQIDKIEDLYNKKDYKNLKKEIARTEYDIYFVKTKSDYLLKEVKEVTLSGDRNREEITKAKALYRNILAQYNNNKSDYSYISKAIDLQIENIDKLFSAFEVAMDNNSYQEIGKIVKALQDMLGNLKLVIDEAPSIILIGTKLIPLKKQEIVTNKNKLVAEGYNLDYLNIDYNISEADKKVKDALERLNVLNIEDSTIELKTILDYLENLGFSFESEVKAKSNFATLMGSILVKINNAERINNKLSRSIDDYKYSYDLTDEDVAIIPIIKEELRIIRQDYERLCDGYRNRTFAYSRLNKEMLILNDKLSETVNKLQEALKGLGSLKQDEVRAREQLIEIKDIFKQAVEIINTYKLPVIPDYYYIEKDEAIAAIKEMVKELAKQPISIRTLNLRVDTARDLTLKLYNTSKVIVKTAKMVEMTIVFGNRYRSFNEDIDYGLNKSEKLFNDGRYKDALEVAINAIEEVEPDFYNDLKLAMEKKEG